MSFPPDVLFKWVKAGDLQNLKGWVNNIDPNGRDNRQRTPLHWAALLGRTEIAEILISVGASPHALDEDGKSPLLAAAEYGQVDTAKLLLQRGASPATRAKTSETALHLAVRCKNPPFEPGTGPRDSQGMTELLAQIKYLVDYRMADGRTALMITAADDNAGMARALLRGGADPSLKDERGFTAADWARETGADYTLQVVMAAEAAREARGGLTKKMLVGQPLKLKAPKV